ncbi:hypothetical protein RhiirC2_801017 [Rhizophagus irregularis]|uniref:Uncharacterized protein n=1 Tax=Rhizophagus irregularis TaxID=588596 RepID=A0A2N1M2U9_9GLOM|nr:hypothetical protein RhiirC2_801017 [Rhizophagus irregularis]
MISTLSGNETESDYIMSLEIDEKYETMSSDNEERHDSDILEEKLFVDKALAKDNDIIWNVLNNPSLLKEMYFSAGVDLKTKSEYWHGTLWAESPLFG